MMCEKNPLEGLTISGGSAPNSLSIPDAHVLVELSKIREAISKIHAGQERIFEKLEAQEGNG